MQDPLSPCPECSYGVESSTKNCPNCGINLEKTQASFLDIFWKKDTPARSTETLQSLEAHLKEEVDRLQETLSRLEQTRGPLVQRRDSAANQGRSTRALDEGLASLDQAAREADLLLRRHTGLLAGIDLDRRHNALLLELHNPTAEGDAQPPPVMWDGNLPLCALAALPGTQDWVGLSADGRQLLWLKDGSSEKLAVPGMGARLLKVAGPWLALGGDGAVQLYHRPSSAWVQPARLSRGSLVAMDVAGDTLLVGMDSGKLQRFKLSAGGSFGNKSAQRLKDEVVAHPFGLADVALLAGGKRAMSCGGGWITSWFLTDSGFQEFHKGSLEGAASLCVDEEGGRLLVLRSGRIAEWDLGLTNLAGEVEVPPDTQRVMWAPDGVRALLLRPGGVEVASLRTRKRLPLKLNIAGALQAIAFRGMDCVVCSGNAVFDSVQIAKLSLEDGGPTGVSMGEIVRLRELVREVRPHVPKDIGERAMADQVLVEQGQEFVGDAGRLAISRIVQRAAGAELQPAAQRMGAFELLFEELDDLIAGLQPAAEMAGSLGPSLRRLVRLPTAVLLGQVDQVLGELERVLGVQSTEQELDLALSELQGLERWLMEIERLSNGLTGVFWGTPDRALLVDAVRRLQTELPEVADALHARLAAVVVGRVDRLSGEHALEKLRDQRKKVQGIGGLGAAGAGDELEERVDGGPLGQEHAAKERAGHLERLGEARRELGAETEAFLEVQGT